MVPLLWSVVMCLDFLLLLVIGKFVHYAPSCLLQVREITCVSIVVSCSLAIACTLPAPLATTSSTPYTATWNVVIDNVICDGSD